MNSNFRMAIISGAAVCGLALQLTCQAQSAASSSSRNPEPQAAKAAPPALVELAALEEPGANPGASANGVASSDAAAAPAAASSAATSGSAAAAPASIVAPIKNDAVIKELGDMKKQFDQMTQMQGVIKARMARLESELDTDAATGDSVSAEKDAGALRSATGDGGSDGSLTIGQAAAAPAPAA